MKKLLALILVLVLALSLFTACNGGDSNDSNGADDKDNALADKNNNDKENENGDDKNNGDKSGDNLLAMSITAANGWKSVPDLVTNPDTDFRYQPEDDFAFNTVLSLAVRENYMNFSDRKFVENEMDVQKILRGSYNFTDITETTIGGYKALEYTMADLEYDDGSMMIQAFICKGKYVYEISRSTTRDQYDKWSADFDAMLSSFTLK